MESLIIRKRKIKFDCYPEKIKLIDRFKIKLFKYLFSENEKCLMNQALNLQKHEIYKDLSCGLNTDYKQDIDDLNILLKMCENKLWN
ncbi:hypothetical protein Phi19:3_gp115 [Cellulophaga phage phi19:3]|uniref:Uncharacterized protein n=1 Tax=Cellulophaga phage phi19:3 TaxID=1327971 RepID=R9ZWE2_9CAUD|nr:hypothetical protein Phi19:3_gp115 [Cellulophaga phage phi19:3]AGO47519.1 hypothetical protein Phi19:3_gp115 [Cellulophaga phage phi19:3]